MLFKSRRQQKAVMRQLQKQNSSPKQHFLTSLKKAMGMKQSIKSNTKLVDTYEKEVTADKQLIRAGNEMPKSLVGEALKMTGKIRLHNDQYYLNRLKEQKRTDN